MSSFPAARCRVVASRVHGDDAYVLLDTGSGGRRYLCGANCHRRGGHWLEGISGNGGGWSRNSADDGTGTLVIWGEAPAGADRVRVELDGDTIEGPVSDGVYLEAWWNVPASHDHSPRVVAFRVEDQWRS